MTRLSMADGISPNGTDPEDGDHSYRWSLEEGVRNDPGHAVDELERLTAEVERLRAIQGAALAYCTAPSESSDPDAPDVEGLYYDLRRALGLRDAVAGGA